METMPLDDKKTLRKQRKLLAKEKYNAKVQALHSQPLRKINKEGLQYLRKALGLLPDSHDFDMNLDAIFIAIDFEHSQYRVKIGSIRLREVGISRLDTRDLRRKQPERLVFTMHYRTVTDTKQFLYGKSRDVEQDELVAILNNILLSTINGTKEPRKIVLVGHGFSFEI